MIWFASLSFVWIAFDTAEMRRINRAYNSFQLKEIFCRLLSLSVKILVPLSNPFLSPPLSVVAVRRQNYSSCFRNYWIYWRSGYPSQVNVRASLAYPSRDRAIQDAKGVIRQSSTNISPWKSYDLWAHSFLVTHRQSLYLKSLGHKSKKYIRLCCIHLPKYCLLFKFTLFTKTVNAAPSSVLFPHVGNYRLYKLQSNWDINKITDSCYSCLTDLDECASNPCSNGGLCVNGVNKFTCNCFPGFTGLQCETSTS